MAYPRFFTRIKADIDYKETATVHYVMNLSRHEKIQGSTKIKVDSRYFKPEKKGGRQHYVDLKVAEKLGLKEQAEKKETQLITLANSMVAAWDDIEDDNYDKPVEELKTRVDFLTGKKKRVIATTKKLRITDLIDHYIQVNKTRLDPNSAASYYPNLKKRLLSFEDYHKTKLDYDMINHQFKEMFFDDFVEDVQFYKGDRLRAVKQNSKHTMYRRFSAVMTFGLNENFHDNKSYRNFNVPNTRPKKVYLTPDEIEKIKKVRLTGTRDKVREIFLLCLETGARIEDVLNFNTIDNMATGYIYWIQQKTKDVVTQDLTPELQRILDKYSGFPNETGTKLKYITVLDELKPICKDAGITDLVDIGDGEIPKWAAVSPHTGRVTKGTNMRLAGSPWEDIRKVLGHGTVETSKGYFHATTDDIRAIIKRGEKV